MIDLGRNTLAKKIALSLTYAFEYCSKVIASLLCSKLCLALKLCSVHGNVKFNSMKLDFCSFLIHYQIHVAGSRDKETEEGDKGNP